MKITNKTALLEIERNQISNCKLCGELPKLINNSIQLGKTNFIIIGESTAKNGWIESKQPFFDASGKIRGSGRILNRLLNLIDLSIYDIYFTNCCKCVISERKNLSKCSNNCLPILIKQLNNIPCKTIITMGLHPTQTLLKTKIKKFADFVGKEFLITLGTKQYTLIPIYHPSPLNPKGFKNNVEIFKALKK